jgi:HipA-like protein
MTKELIAILDGQITGRVVRDTRGRISLTYDDNWREAENAYPLSLSMPLALSRHGNDKIGPFLWGLLPDNELVLDQWARKFQVSARNAFSLISAVGEDCAGAVQFVRPERLDAVLGQHHAKNYAVLIGAQGRFRLAPFYDMASILPYTQIDIKKAKLSMKLGGEYRFSNIQARHWRKMAQDIRPDPDKVIQRVDNLARQMPDHIADTQRRMTKEGIDHPLIARLARRLTTRATTCRRIFR